LVGGQLRQPSVAPSSSLRDFCLGTDPAELMTLLAELQVHLPQNATSPKIQRLGCAIKSGFDGVANFTWSGRPTAHKGLNCPSSGPKRIGIGFRDVANYRIRALLQTGKLDWWMLVWIVSC
jgi:hypothetical protein